MKKIVITINREDWDVFRITKLVNKVGKYDCDVDIISKERYINMKSIRNMMEYFENMPQRETLEINIDGLQEEYVTNILTQCF